MKRTRARLLNDREYGELAEFRHQIRRFLSFSDESAHGTGIHPQQHQMLLAIRGLPPGHKPTVATVAERLQIRHNSAVELADRCMAEGLIIKWHDVEDRRKVFLRLTERGSAILRTLSVAHLEELRVRGPALIKTLQATLEIADGL